MSSAHSPVIVPASPSARRAWLDGTWWRGLALTGGLAATALWLASTPWVSATGLSALTLAILFGLLAGNTVFPRLASQTGAGVDFSKNRLLRAGIVLYGFRVTFQQIGDVGLAGALIDVLMIAGTFTLALQLGTRVFGLDRQTATLIGAGSAICGAAAVMGTAPVIKAPAHKVAVAVATVVVFGTLAMFLYPVLQTLLQLPEHLYGVYAGSTIHEVAQVVVAGKAVGEQAASSAVIEKMLRVMMLAPFLLLLIRLPGMRDAQTASGNVAIPWFAVLFIVACAIHSTGRMPAAVVDLLVQLDNILLAMAMAALGLRTQASAIRAAGIRPLLLAACLFAFLVIGGLGINLGVHWLFGVTTAPLA
ncbi:MAG TPA: YeiH family protein [Burkholderiaceae bacterium]|jgi:uncharacterized integral membrane protein (TIGR00698 family)|nr:YeiH family protein [Burkholderiaceae bacterium]